MSGAVQGTLHTGWDDQQLSKIPPIADGRHAHRRFAGFRNAKIIRRWLRTVPPSQVVPRGCVAADQSHGKVITLPATGRRILQSRSLPRCCTVTGSTIKTDRYIAL